MGTSRVRPNPKKSLSYSLKKYRNKQAYIERKQAKLIKQDILEPTNQPQQQISEVVWVEKQKKKGVK